MGRRNRHAVAVKSHTLPSSPTHSASSSEFEFTISISPQKSSAAQCPADELFYKGQLLPLHLSPRLSMVRTLLLSSASTSSASASDTSRDSTASHSDSHDCDSSRPSSVADDDFKRLTAAAAKPPSKTYLSLSKFSSVFRKDQTKPPTSSGMRRVSSTAKEVIRRYLKKVKPLYEKLSQKTSRPPPPPPPPSRSEFVNYPKENVTQSFSGNLRYPRRKTCISSCPSSMMSSPSHGKSGSGFGQMNRAGPGSNCSDMDELQSAIQGAIAHCKNSMLKNNSKNLDTSIQT